MQKLSIDWVVFDVGETLINEQRMWLGWADWLVVPRAEFIEALQGVIARRVHHRRVFEMLRPGFDFAAEAARRTLAQGNVEFTETDLFADVRPCFATLNAMGLKIGIVGNTSLATEAMLQTARLDADFISSSGRWAVEKPANAFFTKVAEAASCPPNRIAYVGDRIDNDVIPAINADLHGIFLRRGYWGKCHAGWPEVSAVRHVIDGLDELPALLRHLGRFASANAPR